jgi:CheY-like chemotaxis protein
MFRQILLNLLSNAVKFTPAGGRVDVVVRRDERDLLVSVADSGIGIDGDHLEKIFDEFFQVDGSYSRSYEGTGLGLALVRRMTELQGGEVSAESSPGQGSTFTCRFRERVLESEPLAERTPQVEAPSAPRGGGRTVLIVEDNPMNRKLARNALRSRGFEVLEATTGEEALTLLSRRVADLVLMDLQLPDMDGLEVTRRLKADERTAALPVVALTAHVREVDEQRALEAGCIGYITKPIRLAQFPEQVASCLEQVREDVPAKRG